DGFISGDRPVSLRLRVGGVLFHSGAEVLPPVGAVGSAGRLRVLSPLPALTSPRGSVSGAAGVARTPALPHTRPLRSAIPLPPTVGRRAGWPAAALPDSNRPAATRSASRCNSRAS